MNKIVSKQKYLLNHHFLDVATFDFLGDSIVEGVNGPIKFGPIQLNERMSIATSGYNQLQSTEASFNKKNVAKAKKLNTNFNWSRSLTKDYLT